MPTSRPEKVLRSKGVSLPETAASLAVILPIIVACIVASIEIIHFCLIQSSLSDAGHRAARQLAVAYWNDSKIATNRGLQETVVLDNIRISGVVNNNAQFENIVFDLSTECPKVSLKVRFVPGRYGLPRLSTVPLDLNGLSITAESSHSLD